MQYQAKLNRQSINSSKRGRTTNPGKLCNIKQSQTCKAPNPSKTDNSTNPSKPCKSGKAKQEKHPNPSKTGKSTTTQLRQSELGKAPNSSQIRQSNQAEQTMQYQARPDRQSINSRAKYATQTKQANQPTQANYANQANKTGKALNPSKTGKLTNTQLRQGESGKAPNSSRKRQSNQAKQTIRYQARRNRQSIKLEQTGNSNNETGRATNPSETECNGPSFQRNRHSKTMEHSAACCGI
jgi:hypothetical protein